MAQRFRFGLFELDPRAGELYKEGRAVPLQEQPLRLLELLLERPGEIVSREAIRAGLWPPGVHVDFDTGLNAAIRRLREALDDNATNPRFVATVPKKGYRFIAPVEVPATGRARAKPLAMGIAAMGIAAITSVVVIRAMKPTQPRGRPRARSGSPFSRSRISPAIASMTT